MKTGNGKYKESYDKRAKLMNLLKPYGISRYHLQSLHNPAKGTVRIHKVSGDEFHVVPFYISYGNTKVFKYRGRLYDASKMSASKKKPNNEDDEMKLHVKKIYYKRSRIGGEPCKYSATQPNGVNTDVYATIKLDPILRKKKLKPIKNAMIGHEVNEIKHWAQGKPADHRYANSKEPYITRVKLKGVDGFWAEVGRMKKKGEIK